MWFLTLHRWVGGGDADLTVLDDHLRWMHEQQLGGTVIAAGPTPDRKLGIILVRHMPREDLDALFRTEPFVRGGYREYEVIPWEVHHVLGIGGFDRGTVMAMVASELPESDR